MPAPNILLIVSDDHGYADRGGLGVHSDVQTPALDRLAAEGVTCTDAYVTAPICSPSRASIISGRYQQRWGGQWFDSAAFPPDDVPTLAEVLRHQGYRTGYFGKVHYGKEDVGDRACPPHHGFEETLYGLAGQSFGRLNYLHHSDDAVESYGQPAAHHMAVQPLLSGDEPVEHEGFLTAEFGRRATEFIGADDERPYFCMVAFNAVHNFCWQLPESELKARGLPAFRDWSPEADGPFMEWYDDVIVPNLPHGREYYLAQLELMDAEIGRLLDAAGDDTIVVYVTDNGGSTCNFGDNSPLRGTKYTLWDGGIRIPMLWRWPGQMPAGRRTDALVSTLDLVPTLAAAAGATVDGTDGVDILPVLTGVGDVAHENLHWDCGFQWAVRSGDWKLSWVDDNASTRHLRDYEHAPMGEGWFLANLADDIGEQRNELSAQPEVAARLRALHADWRAAVGLEPQTVNP
ncbi:arylsulfatase A-like enzyme [Kribbella aluminosa]|uniref:Arylsulfatase A-like enzyme n=1 Tax=Kribbella aluminosa TaxID=416017 RepID=A0ABS4UYW1_9ACTN|nr:sulfatase-like hydrolase/transferase [Kribbella aluminosa]MBP2356824.1 arylsulfatase A-like enzyme [Kribbella aluminosa]